jgi:hypothetical protein
MHTAPNSITGKCFAVVKNFLIQDFKQSEKGESILEQIDDDLFDIKDEIDINLAHLIDGELIDVDYVWILAHVKADLAYLVAETESDCE